ncbi:MAG TPA: flagellar assembly protein FliX [Geminicoccus sp.]|jgi:hypothetical protein|uniref:flagellar assembly protein FliX n=1 Tax=Geminicoccus sp. TaxID=2024832 RepID=UPI002E3347FD|nr:flagellar assembly protein FliX [Geminicoccus sp.]HEX2528178.1 flagellar assembly protein FliX [Geminicoccus sp.]
MLVQTLPSLSIHRLREVGHTSGPRFQALDRTRPGGAGHGPGSTAALTSLGTLLAVQQVEPAGPERRRRAIRRGEQLLAALEDMQMSLLSGDLPVQPLARIRALMADDARAGDDELDGILREIEVRAAVELAKQEQDARR